MKYAVVTGSTKGIGRSIVEKLLKNGYFVIMNYSSDERAREEFELDNKNFSDKFVIYKETLDSYENAKSFCDSVRKITDNIDVLILNCAIVDKSEFNGITKKSWENAMNVNLNVPFYITQDLSNMINENVGRVIFISSVMSKYPHSTSLSYNVSKSALNALSNALVKCFSNKKITVNSICPGFVNTPYHNNRSKESYDKINSKIALERFGEPDEISSLCMEIINNQYINGANIDINGGYNYF